MKTSLLLHLALLLVPGLAFAQASNPYVTFESTSVKAGQALPGSNVVVTASFKIKEGFYLHSNRPLVRQATPTYVQVGQSYSARALPVAYDFPASRKTLPGVVQPVDVYEGLLSVQVPVVISRTATFPITLPGSVSFVPVQAKNHTPADRVQRVNFTVTIPRTTNQPPATARSNTKTPPAKGPGKK